MILKSILPLEIIENYKKSGRQMENLLFKPIDLNYWLKLGFLSFFNQIPLFLFIFFLNFVIIPSRFLNWNKIFPILPHIFITFPFLFFLFLFFFGFFIFISGYSNYFYFEFLFEKRRDFSLFEDYHNKLAINFALLSFIVFLLLVFLLFSGLFFIFIFGEILTKFYVFLFFFLFLIFFYFIQIVLKDIYIPLSYIKGYNIFENLNIVLSLILSNLKKFFIFAFVKMFLIAILFSGIIFMGLFSFGILFIIFIIPVLGQTLLQPVISFLNIFGLNYFQKISKLESSFFKNEMQYMQRKSRD